MKKLLSALLTIVMFFAVLGTIGLFAMRNAISSNSMEKMIDTLSEEYDFVEKISGEFTDEVDDLLSNKKIKKGTSNLASEYLKYIIGATEEKPDFRKFAELVVEETDSELDKDEIDNLVDDLEDEIEAERLSEDDDTIVVFKTIYSNGLLITTIVISVVCAIGIYFLNKNPKKTLRRVGIVLTIDGALIMGLGTILINSLEGSVSSVDEMSLNISKIMLGGFNTAGLISIIIGLVLIFVSPIVIKMLSGSKNSNQEIVNQSPTI